MPQITINLTPIEDNTKYEIKIEHKECETLHANDFINILTTILSETVKKQQDYEAALSLQQSQAKGKDKKLKAVGNNPKPNAIG